MVQLMGGPDLNFLTGIDILSTNRHGDVHFRVEQLVELALDLSPLRGAGCIGEHRFIYWDRYRVYSFHKNSSSLRC